MFYQYKFMYNTEKINKLKKVLFVMGAFFIVFISIIIGISIGTSQKKEQQKPVQQVEEKKEELTTDVVKDFLIAFYTRKDLGENRNRFEPLVTTAMYNQLLDNEEQPVNQAYKGYVVNQVLDSAEIYIDTENSIAICVVTYKNTQRTKLGTDEGALLNQTNKEAQQISFKLQGKKYLVDKMTPVTLTNLLNTSKNTYNTYSTETSNTMDSDSTYNSDNTVGTSESFEYNYRNTSSSTEGSISE